MRRLNLAAVLGSVVGLVAVGCGGGEVANEDMIEPVAVAPTVNLRSLLANRGESRLVATMRGPGQIGYLQPITRRDGNEMNTQFRLQNTSQGALAGFKVDEFWYDADGETVTGGSFRMRRPFLPNEIIAVDIVVPRDARMNRSNYEFSHQNGVIEATLFEEMDEPTAETEAAEAEAAEAEAAEAEAAEAEAAEAATP